MDPPDEFQFPPKRVVLQEPSERTKPIVPVADTEMEDLPDTQQDPQNPPSTPQNPPSAEAGSEEETDLPEQVEFPAKAGSNEWEEWDDYPLEMEQSGDNPSPEPRPQLEKKRKMKETGEYTQKRQRETADQTESESEVDDDPLGLVQPSDQQDVSYRLYQLTTRRKGEGTTYHKSRGRWIEPTCGRLMTLSQSPTEEQESEPKAQSSNKKRRSWVPKAVLSLWDHWNSRPEMDTLSVKL